jgi:hypothetical protein
MVLNRTGLKKEELDLILAAVEEAVSLGAKIEDGEAVF